MSFFPELEKCPKCGALGHIDYAQQKGAVSIICSECGYHYFKEKVEDDGSNQETIGEKEEET